MYIYMRFLWKLYVIKSDYIFSGHVLLCEYIGCSKKGFTTLKEYRPINLFRRHVQCFEMS
jgi:hypothetical protein